MRARREPTAVLLMAYGTPRTRAEILPFYTDVRRGQPPTPALLADLVRRYDAIAPSGSDVLSPLALRTEAQRHALQLALDDLAPGRFSVSVAFKHAEPRLERAVRCIAAHGIRRIVCLALAPHFSAVSVGGYIARVHAAAASRSIDVVPIESWATAPAFVEFLARAVETSLAAMPRESVVCFTAHSLPRRLVDRGDRYAGEVAATATAVADRLGLARNRWSVAWQSAGRTADAWLLPDVLDVVGSHASAGTPGLVVCACGFVADHLEVLYDLDIEANGHAAARALPFARTQSVNDDPAVFAGLARQVLAA